MNWESSPDMYTPPCVKQKLGEAAYSTGSSVAAL